jgi:hypothetical protein
MLLAEEPLCAPTEPVEPACEEASGVLLVEDDGEVLEAELPV